MRPLSIAFQGATGRVGSQILKALCKDPEIEVLGVTSLDADGPPLRLPDGSREVPHSLDLESLLTQCSPSMIVDFSHIDASLPMAKKAIDRGLHVVIGTSGYTLERAMTLDKPAREKGVCAAIIPNFALGAVLMIHMAKLASRYFDYAEIIELHHETKIDSPSGTAVSTAEAMAQARGRPFEMNVPQKETLQGTRGAPIEGIPIHSVRLQGLIAHQEVMLGGLGQTLTIRHDTVSREAFVPGVIMAIKEAPNRVGLVYGLESILGLEG